MDGNQPPHPPDGDGQPHYPPMPPGQEDPYLQQHPNHRAPAPPGTAPHHQAPPPHHMHHVPPTAAAATGYGSVHHPGAPPSAGGGGSAMSALTAAAAAAHPAPPTSMHPGTMHHPPQPQTLPTRTPSQGAGQGSTAGGVPLRVVESGHEHTGRWTKEEHESFLSALQLYGKEWKKVAAKVKTRTVVQTRTHAQKYFQKLQKGGEKETNQVHGMPGGPGLGMGGVSPAVAHSNLAAIMDLGVPNSSEKATKKKRGKSSAQKQKQQQQQQQLQHAHYQPPPLPAASQSAAAAAAMSRSSSATAATLLNMSNDRRLSATGLGPPSSTTAGAYSVSVPNPAAHHQHGFTTTAGPGGDASTSAHGFGYPAAATGVKPMSIVAPTYEDMVKVGKFPEPSPAACGKRKMDEIAAAQMLAGVVGVVASQTASSNTAGPSPKKRASVSGSAAIAAAEYAVDATETAEPVMPPESSYPEPTPVGGGEGQIPTPPPPSLEEYVAALKPAAADSAQSGSMVGSGLSLQIVNPDTLAAQDNGSAKRRFMNGQASPSTPWDGQLEALVSQVKGQEPQPQDPNANDPASISENAMVNQEEVMAAVSELNILLPLPLRSPRSTLQQAVCHGLVNEVTQICSTLTVSNSSVVTERDDAGYYPLHSAAALGLVEHFGSNGAEAMEICRLLIDCGADVACRDAKGNTPVHWAARAGHTDVLGLLLLKSCPLDVQNEAGETALHWAMRAGDMGAGAVKVLVENGARVNVFNRSFRRPLDVAAEGFAAMEDEEGPVVGTKVDQQARRSARWNLMECSSQCRTLVLHHQECLDHLAKTPHDWEVPDRIDNIVSTLMSRTNESCLPGDDQSFKPYEVTISTEFERATLELLSRIHSAEYLAFVNDLSKELERKRKQQILDDNLSPSAEGGQDNQNAIVPFTPMVQRQILKEETTKEGGHSDTAFSAGSLKAARRAAGAVQHAVDCVLVGRNRNAFCIVRPPGHHAGINGLLSDAESCGFCLFNNVAAGAMHALSDEKHRPRCERCAIVDIDAHHGNGTEEIVRKCHDSGRLLFFSVHLYDHDKPKKGQTFQYKFYPGSGVEDDVAHNIINVPIAPLWREKEVVKSISLAANGGPPVPEPRQTRQRSKEGAAKRVPSLPDLSKFNNDEAAQAAASLKPSSVASVGSASATSDSSQASKPRPLPSTSPNYPPHYQAGTGRLAYRRAIQHRLLPALRAFNPDLIILSTGLDAARGDVGNARHYVNGTEAMGFDLEPADYAWTARKVCEIADICCDGRVVSVLEGGYGRTPPPVPPPPVFGDESVEPTAPVKQKLDKSFFSECAVQHLKGLVDPYHAGDDQQNDAKRS